MKSTLYCNIFWWIEIDVHIGFNDIKLKYFWHWDVEKSNTIFITKNWVKFGPMIFQWSFVEDVKFDSVSWLLCTRTNTMKNNTDEAFLKMLLRILQQKSNKEITMEFNILKWVSIADESVSILLNIRMLQNVTEEICNFWWSRHNSVKYCNLQWKFTVDCNPQVFEDHL